MDNAQQKIILQINYFNFIAANHYTSCIMSLVTKELHLLNNGLLTIIGIASTQKGKRID